MLYDKTYVMNGKQLKNSILQWAIQGKLVPQDPNDEPASVLLDKIRQEKERLIKEKKIKRDKNASIIYRGEDNSYYEKILATGEVTCIDEEVPFEIPTSWSWARLGNLIDIKGGKRLPAGYKLTDNKTDHIYIRVSDMQDGTIVSKDLKYITDDVYNQIQNYTIGKDDLYLTIVGSTIGKAGLVPKMFDNMNLTENAVKLTNIPINKYFLLYYVRSGYAQSQFRDNTKQVGQPKLAIFRIANTLVPIPPFAEQTKIVSKIEYTLHLVNHFSNLQEQLHDIDTDIYRDLKKSILQEAIQGKLVPQIAEEGTAKELLELIKAEKQKLVKEGKLKKSALNDSVIFRGYDNKYYELIGSEVSEIELPFEIPNSWSLARLNAVCQLTDGLKTTGKQCLLDAKYLRGKSSETIVEQGKLVYKGDNIMLVDGENSGEVFIVPQDGYMGSTFKQLWISSSMYEPYVLAFIQFYKETLRNSKKGAAIPHLNKELFYGLIIGIPPLQEQRRIVQKIEQLMQLLK